MTAALTPEHLLTPGEVAALLGIDPKQVARKANAGVFTYIRTPGAKGPGHRRFPAAQFEGLVNVAERTRERSAVATLRRVRGLHLPFRHRVGPVCRGCSKVAGRPVPHPCPTWLVVNGGEDVGEFVPVDAPAELGPDEAALTDVVQVLGEPGR